MGGRLAQFLLSQPGDEIILGSRKRAEAPYWLPHAKVIQTQWDSSARLEEICRGVDAVIHLAGMNAEECAAEPVAALEVNAVATHRLLQAAVQQKVERFIYLSTAHVYGSPLTGVISEDNCPAPSHPYAVSNRAGEDVVRAAHQRGEIKGIVIRLSNAFGAPAYKDANCWMLLVNDLCRQAVTTKHMVLRTSGLQRRDFITLTDSCRAIKHLLYIPADDLGDGLFNVGGGWSPTVLEISQRISKRFMVVTDQTPEILRKTDQNTESAETLSFETKKLIDTGFQISSNNIIDYELDALILFCVANFQKERSVDRIN